MKILNGVHLNHHKNTENESTVIFPLPASVTIPMAQGMGAPCEPLVAVGDNVFVGQKIGESEQYMSIPVHSSVSGTVTEIKEYVRCFCPCDDEERAKMWETLGYIDIQFLAPRIKADTLWFTGLMDNVCPPSTQFAAYNKITANKEMVIYTNHGHEGNWRTDDRAFQFIVNHPTNK